MPIYEYRCAECGHRYERREGFDAPSLQHCPRCGAEARRVIHAPPILFKARGFYVTDNRKDFATESAADHVESVTGGDSKKTESKSDKSDVAGDMPKETAAAS